MASIGLLGLFNVAILLSPPQLISDMLTLMPVPHSGRWVLLCLVLVNVLLSLVFEQYGARYLAGWVGAVLRWHRSGRRRAGKAYKIVEGGMR
jgi:cation-transporting ATPase 13A2